MQIFLIVALLIAIVAVVFAVYNTALVTITFFAWHFQTSLAVALLAALGAGVLIAILFSVPGWIKNGMSSVSQKKKFSGIQSERDNLKQKYDALLKELDGVKAKLTASENEVSNLEEQLASVSALVPAVPAAASTGNKPGTLESSSTTSANTGPDQPIQ